MVRRPIKSLFGPLDIMIVYQDVSDTTSSSNDWEGGGAFFFSMKVTFCFEHDEVSSHWSVVINIMFPSSMVGRPKFQAHYGRSFPGCQKPSGTRQMGGISGFGSFWALWTWVIFHFKCCSNATIVWDVINLLDSVQNGGLCPHTVSIG